MSVRETSLDAYQTIRTNLTAKQREVMLTVYERFDGRKFTRKQLAKALGWEINRVTGRVLELIEKLYLEECGTTVEDGFKATLVQIRPRQMSLLEAA